MLVYYSRARRSKERNYRPENGSSELGERNERNERTTYCWYLI